MKILIFGSCGSIGSELVRQLYKENTIYAVDQNETGINDLLVDYGVVGRVGDIRDYDTVNDIFSDFTPDVVYIASALKHVGQMEVTPLEAIKTNCIGTYNILHCAKRYEVTKLVYISTDKVHGYSVMGATKRVGEIMTMNQGYTVVRFGNVLSSNGSVIPIWKRQKERGEPITVTDPDMTRYMMSIKDAVELVVEAGDRGIWILDMGEPRRIGDMAEIYAGKAGIKVIGKRPGEAMHEKLMSVEEEKIVVRKGRFFVIKY